MKETEEDNKKSTLYNMLENLNLDDDFKLLDALRNQ